MKNMRERERERERETYCVSFVQKVCTLSYTVSFFSSDFLINSGRILLFGPRNVFHCIVIKLFCLLKQAFTVVIISRVEDRDF